MDVRKVLLRLLSPINALNSKMACEFSNSLIFFLHALTSRLLFILPWLFPFLGGGEVSLEFLGC